MASPAPASGAAGAPCPVRSAGDRRSAVARVAQNLAETVQQLDLFTEADESAASAAPPPRSGTPGSPEPSADARAALNTVGVAIPRR